MTLRWDEFAAEAPDLAEAGERLLNQFGSGLGFLATVRPDGGPRLHPICPVIAEGDLWAFIIERSPKCADLVRDGRYALHSFPPDEVDDEFVVHGRAERVAVEDGGEHGSARWKRLCAATTASVGRPDEVLFRLEVESVLLATYQARGVFPPTHTHWPT